MGRLCKILPYRGEKFKMRKADEVISLLFRQRFGEDFMDNARSSTELFNSWEKAVRQVWPHWEELSAEPTGRSSTPVQKDDDIPAAAVHSWIKELERGVLIVETDHPGWIQILQTKQTELLLAVQRYCPKQDIRGIAFRLGREAVSPGMKNPVRL